MTIYVLVREDQNDHGFIDTSIVGLFLSRELALQDEAREREAAEAEGLIVEDDGAVDWQVCWRIEDHTVLDAAPSAGSARP